jgi:hypothetical protein
MAKLSAHGTEIGRLVFTAYSKAYMSDGKILKNYGDGWKLSAKLKLGVNPEDYFKKCQVRLIEWAIANPEAAAYKKALHNLTSQSNRSKLAISVQLMPDDADGIWSDCCDGWAGNIHADLDEIAELCQLYLAIPRKETETA